MTSEDLRLRRRRRSPGRTGFEWCAAAGLTLVVLLLVTVSPERGGLLLVAASVGLSVAAVALRNPVAATLILLVASYLRAPLQDVLPVDAVIVTLALLGLSLVLYLLRREGRWHLEVLDALMIAYVGWNLLSIAIPHELAGEAPGHFLLRGTVLPFTLYVVGRVAFLSRESVRALLWLVGAFTAYSTFNAIVQVHGPSWMVWPHFEDTESGWVGRAVGVFYQPVVNGLLLVIGLAVLFFLAAEKSRTRWQRVALYALSLGAIYAIYATHTRSALLGLVVVLVLGALLAKGWRAPFVITLATGVVVVAVNWAAFSSSDRSEGGVGSSHEVLDRLNIAATALRAIGEHPVVGIGLARFSEYNTRFHTTWSWQYDWVRGYGIVSHENELGIAAELGLVGLALWLGVLALVARRLVKAYRHASPGDLTTRGLLLLGVFALAVWIVTATTVDMRFLDFANALPFLLIGVVVGPYERWLTTSGTSGSVPAEAPAPRDDPAPASASPPGGLLVGALGSAPSVGR